DPPRDEDVLEIARHMHLGAAGIVGEAERRRVAELNLRAGKKAKATTAYKTAADSFTAAIDLLGPEGWEHARLLCFDLHVECAECAYLSGEIERAEALFERLLPRASSDLSRARIHNLRVTLYTTLGNFTEAVRAGRAGLACVGVTLPETQAELLAAFG